MNATSTLRIFISSPGDVNEERDKARRVIEDLQRLYPSVKLLPVLWEDLALPATASFQGTIDYILRQQPIDIAVFILYSGRDSAARWNRKSRDPTAQNIAAGPNASSK